MFLSALPTDYTGRLVDDSHIPTHSQRSLMPVHLLSQRIKRNSSAAMSTKKEGSQQGDKIKKKLSAMNDLGEALDATSILDRTATANTSSGSNAEDDDDDGLFDPPPPNEDCALCAILLPNKLNQLTYHACCGKILCSGCHLKNYAVRWWTNEKRAVKDPPQPPLELTCAFCRADEDVSDEIMLQRYQKRMNLNDPLAFNNMASFYQKGSHGLPKDKGKAIELYLRAAELGSPLACWNIARQYKEKGGALGHDRAKYIKYLKKAAKRGHVEARYTLGVVEGMEGNTELAVKHWMISAEAGDDNSLKCIGLSYRNKIASKTQYEKAIRSHQKAKKEASSDERKMAKKVNDAGGDFFSILSESELAGLCGVRKAERALFSRLYHFARK